MKSYRRVLQITILVAILAIGALTLAGSLFDKNEIPKEGSAAPAFTLQGLSGEKHSLSDYTGKVVVINFWGTYCPPCVREMPLIQKYYDKYKDQGVVVIGVNENDPLVSVKGFVRQYKLTFPILLDKDTVRKKYGVTAYPATFFVDTDGKIAVIQPGEMDEAFISRTLASLVKS